MTPRRACRGWKLLTFTLKHQRARASDAHNSPLEFFFVHCTKMISGMHLVYLSTTKKVCTFPESEQRTLVSARHRALCQSCKYLEMFRNCYIHMDAL